MAGNTFHYLYHMHYLALYLDHADLVMGIHVIVILRVDYCKAVLMDWDLHMYLTAFPCMVRCPTSDGLLCVGGPVSSSPCMIIFSYCSHILEQPTRSSTEGSYTVFFL